MIKLGALGKSKTQIAAALGTSTMTLWNWANANPEFAEAMRWAKELEQAWWENQGQKGIHDRSFNSTTFIFQMKNRFRDQYFDHQVVTGPGGAAVQQVVLDPSKLKKLSDKELEAIVANISRIQKGALANGSGGPPPADAKGEEAYAAIISPSKAGQPK